MKKNVIFVIVFIAVILGLVKLHSIASEDQKNQTINIKGVVDLQYPASVEVRNDIPFELLINPEDKKLLPDSVNCEKFRPDLIFLQKGFNEKDSLQLKEFPNIVANVVSLEYFDASTLKPEHIEALGNKVNDFVKQNANRTSSIVSEWKTLPMAKINGVTALKFEYKLTNKNGKILYIIISYLLKGNKQVEIILSSPKNDLVKWTAIYNKVLNTVSIN